VFSSRSSVAFEPSPLSVELSRARADSASLIDLTVSNPTRAGLPYDAERILAAFGDPRALRYEPAPFGPLTAREAVSADWAAQSGVRISPERVVMTASSSESYGFLFKLLCDAGDEVLIPAPSYPLFEHLARLEGVMPVPYRLAFDGAWFTDFESVRAQLTARTRAIVVVSPNNPTGHYASRAELAEIARLGLPLISDEVFASYELARPPAGVRSALEQSETLTFALSGLSKLCALPQMKVGWIGVAGPDAKVREALARLELIADTYLSVNTPALVALPELLAQRVVTERAIAQRLRENLELIERAARDAAFSALPVEGGWYAVLRLPHVLSEEDWVRTLLRSDHLLVEPGYFYDFAEEPYCVVSLLSEPREFQRGLSALRERVALTAFGDGGERAR
jgi:alanine-synthesizing transaminase